MEIIKIITEEILKNLLVLISLLTGSFTIYITTNISRMQNNQKRHLKLSKQIPSISKLNYNPITHAKFDKTELKKLQDTLSQTTYPKELTELVKQFKNYVSPENFVTCLNNLKTININHLTLEKDIKAYLINLKSMSPKSGIYFPYQNEINIYDDISNKTILSHEFLHMASTNDKYNCGFYIITRFDDEELGRGINEGYTELLNHRIFNSKNKAYYHNVKIARLFEIFFDNPKDMEYAYFHGHLEPLYEVFSLYGTKEEFLEIMNNLDNLATTNIPIYNTITSIKTQLKLYQIIKRSQNKEKLAKFKNILDENPLIKLLENGNPITLANKPKISKTK